MGTPCRANLRPRTSSIPITPIPVSLRKWRELRCRRRGVNVSVVRLPQVHDPVKQGLITPAVALAREKGVSAYVGDGLNRWPAAHVLDVARLYRLALEKREAGAGYHAVAEEGISVREIAEVIGRGLKVPWFRCRRRRPRVILDGSRRSPSWISRPQARKPSKDSDGSRPARTDRRSRRNALL